MQGALCREKYVALGMLPAFFLANRTSRRIARFGSGFLESVPASAPAGASLPCPECGRQVVKHNAREMFAFTALPRKFAALNGCLRRLGNRPPPRARGARPFVRELTLESALASLS